MSTRSMIAMAIEGGLFRAVYCHWDGYPAWNGRILCEYYDAEKTAALLDNGFISVLRQEIGEKHDFNNQDLARENEWTTFYGRDRGETDVDAVVCEDLLDLVKTAQDMWCEYVYIYEGEWSHIDLDQLEGVFSV